MLNEGQNIVVKYKIRLNQSETNSLRGLRGETCTWMVWYDVTAKYMLHSDDSHLGCVKFISCCETAGFREIGCLVLCE